MKHFQEHLRQKNIKKAIAESLEELWDARLTVLQSIAEELRPFARHTIEISDLAQLDLSHAGAVHEHVDI